MGNQMAPLQNIPPWAIAIILCLLIATFTECTSNVATATLFLPVLASMVSSPTVKKNTVQVVEVKFPHSVFYVELDSPLGVDHWNHSQYEPACFPLFGYPSSRSFKLNMLGPFCRAPPPINNLPNTTNSAIGAWNAAHPTAAEEWNHCASLTE